MISLSTYELINFLQLILCALQIPNYRCLALGPLMLLHFFVLNVKKIDLTPTADF